MPVSFDLSRRSCQFGRWVAAVVLHVMHGRLVGMKQSMFAVLERLFGRMVVMLGRGRVVH